MQFLRNPEIKKLLALSSVFTLAASLGAAVFEIPTVLYVTAVCMLGILFFLIFTFQRYKDLSELSFQLDQILHGKERTDFVPDKEGELAVLSSEIYKMTIRLQEQSEMLEKEKKYLSDSMADISHQIRTPLTSIRMIVPRLGREELSPRKRREYSLEISRLLSKMEWLVSAMLKIASLESGTVQLKKEPVNIKELTEKALRPLEILLELKGLSLETEIDPDISITGDFLWSMEAVGNIIKNCIEHTPKGGKIRVTACENPLYTQMAISDTGPGFAPEDLPHLFERFYKGKNTGPENIGIGLALSRMIAESQNGTLKAKNLDPNGAEFQIYFYKGAI